MLGSFIELANSALIKVGASTILGFDETSKEAILCNLRYPIAIRTVLRMHIWNFAIKRMALSPLITTPAYGYDYEYQLPADCLRLVGTDLADTDPDAYRIEGRKFLCDSATLSIRYVGNITDPTVIDDVAAEAMACYLAYDISYALTQSSELKKSMWELFQATMRSAKSVDAQEEPAQELEADTWLDSRISGVGLLRAHNSG